MQYQNKNEEFFKLATAARDEFNKVIVDVREQEFHDSIREILVCIMIYVFLYAIAYFTIKQLRMSMETDEYVLDYEDAIADRVSTWLCTFTLATCFGAVLLLPMSIIANEVIIITPHSYYWKWLNSSLIHGLWNIIFLFSNLSLFIFLPFAHLFVESIGLPGYRRGIKSRIIETMLILIFVAIIMIGISFVISSVFDSDRAQSQSFLNISDYHLPFLYSCISFIGVLFLLICTPLGFSRLFTKITNLMMKSTFRIDYREELEVAEFEKNYIERRINDLENRSQNDQQLIAYLNKLEETQNLIQRFKKRIKAINTSSEFVLSIYDDISSYTKRIWNVYGREKFSISIFRNVTNDQTFR